MRLDDRSLLHMSPGMRLAVFLGTSGISMLLGAFITFSLVAAYLHVGFSDTQRVLLQPQNAHISLFANALASTIAFLTPSFAVAFFTKGRISKNMGFNPVHSIHQIQWILLLAFSGLLLNGALSSLTELIPISNNFRAWADRLEDSYKKAITAMTQMHSISDLLLNLLAVALIPAFVEELYFRGALQKTLKNWSGRPFVAIVMTAIIFSAFHFSYFGFLSRMGLGIVLGYVFEYTKSIWLTILMHFINNGVAVVALYSVRNDQSKIDKVMDANLPLYWGIVAIAIVIYLLIRLKKTSHYARLENDIRE